MHIYVGSQRFSLCTDSKVEAYVGPVYTKRHKSRVNEKSSYKVLRGHFKLASLHTMYIWLGPWPNAAHCQKRVILYNVTCG